MSNFKISLGSKFISYELMLAELKVKDNGYVGWVMALFALLPLAILATFMNIPSNLQIWAFVGIMGVFIVAVIVMAKCLIRAQNKYAIIADKHAVVFRGKGKFSWDDITCIETESQIQVQPSLRELKYLIVVFKEHMPLK